MEQCITLLYNLSGDCEFGDTKDTMIRNRLVVGHRVVQKTANGAQFKPGQSEENDLSVGRGSGETDNIQEPPDDRASVQVVTRSRQSRGQGQKHQRGKQPQKHRHHQLQLARGSCTRCGKSHAPKSCPAINASCQKCSKRGHYARVCHRKKVAVSLSCTDWTGQAEKVLGQNSCGPNSNSKILKS